MFTKQKFNLEMFVIVCYSYGKWHISIVSSTFPLVDHSKVKVSILALPYKSTLIFVEIFSGNYNGALDKDWTYCSGNGLQDKLAANRRCSVEKENLNK